MYCSFQYIYNLIKATADTTSSLCIISICSLWPIEISIWKWEEEETEVLPEK